MLLIQAGTGTAIGIAVFFVDTLQTGSREFQDVYSNFFASAHLPDTVLVPLIAISFLAATAISVFAAALGTRHFTRWSDRHRGTSAAWSSVVLQTLIGVGVVSSAATIAITFWRLVAP